MSLLDHPLKDGSGLKVVCEACGNFSIQPIDPVKAADDDEIHCRRCNAIRGTMADLREMARRASGEFEF